MVNPLIPMIIATAISTGAQALGKASANRKQERAEKQSSKRKAREMNRETQAHLLGDTIQRGAELESHRTRGQNAQSKKRTKSLMDTSELVRGAFNI